ncbi:MAG: cysteine synthase CysM [Gammaproteobacteria bacterium]|tara:strand:- start:5504 stop:6391 length:888 start_codon:yes stop_codon:yes gene_type:complete
MNIKSISSLIGNTPLVSLQRLNKTKNQLFVKLEGDNPAGSVKDRAAMNMISNAESKGIISEGDTIIEATSGNTGIALAMVCATKGYKLILIMPENMSYERRAAMSAYGADIILVTEEEGMEGARDLAQKMQNNKKGHVLNQFANEDNVEAHVNTTGPEIWNDTDGKVTHFIASMGTTGTIVGTAKYLKSMNPKIKIIGVQPEEGSSIPGIRKWPKEYVPKIYDSKNIDEIVYISQEQAENMARELAEKEGIFSGPSSGGTTFVALQVAKKEKEAVIVSIICDRGDRYVSTGIFNK